MDGDALDVRAKDEGMARLAGGETAKKIEASPPGGGTSKVVKGEKCTRIDRSER